MSENTTANNEPADDPVTPEPLADQTPVMPAAATTAPQATAVASTPRKSRTPWIVGGAIAGVLVLGGAVGLGVLIGRSDDTVTVERITTVDGSGQSADTGSDSAAADDTDGSHSDSSSATDQSDDSSVTTTDVTIAQDDDIELQGDTLTRAAVAATQAAGTGTITSAELSDDPTHQYEVEVTRADGMEMDVYLDANFQVVATKQWHD